MKILIVSATRKEIEPILSIYGKAESLASGLIRATDNNLVIDFLVTGMGMVPTAVKTTRFLAENGYQLTINAGICGSYRRSLQIGEVVNVTTDCFPEVGAENGSKFISVFDMNLADPNEFPFENGKIINHNTFREPAEFELRKVIGNTVNKVHGNEESIRLFLHANDADIETMEGAAFMYAASLSNVPYMQIRAISNYVEERNTSAWNTPLAIENLNNTLAYYFTHVKER